MSRTFSDFFLIMKFPIHKNSETIFLSFFCVSCISIKRGHFLSSFIIFYFNNVFWCVGVEWFIYLIGTWYHGNIYIDKYVCLYENVYAWCKLVSYWGIRNTYQYFQQKPVRIHNIGMIIRLRIIKNNVFSNKEST